MECSARGRWGIYRQLICPGSWLEPELKAILLSRFLPRTGTNGCGPGARPIGPGSCQEPGQMGPDEPGPMPMRPRPAPWAHEPGRMHPLVPVHGRTGTNGLARPERKPLFLGRPFLNTAGAVIDCNKGNVTFHVNGNEHTVQFPRKQPQVHSINSIGKFHRLLLEVLNFLYLLSKRNMIFLLLGMCISPLS